MSHVIQCEGCEGLMKTNAPHLYLSVEEGMSGLLRNNFPDQAHLCLNCSKKFYIWLSTMDKE